MEYLLLENALNRATGYGIVEGAFYGGAGILQGILESDKQHNEKAKELAEYIDEAIDEFNQKLEGQVKVLSIAAYAKKVGKSDRTIRRWIKAGKLKNAYPLGENRRGTWVIISKV
jgi:hypothetical protein